MAAPHDPKVDIPALAAAYGRAQAARTRRGARRGTTSRTEAIVALATRAETYLAQHDLGRLDAQAGRMYLAYRMVRNHILGRALTMHLVDRYHTVKPGFEAQFLEFLHAFVANNVRLVAEVDQFAARHPTPPESALDFPDFYPQLPEPDRQMKVSMKLDLNIHDPIALRMQMARFLLMGNLWSRMGGDRSGLRTVPTAFDPAFERLGWRLIREGLALAEKRRQTSMGERDMVLLLELRADALLLRDRREAGIQQLQEILDRFPTIRQYERLEKRLQRQLGRVHDGNLKRRQRFIKGLEQCDGLSLKVGMSIEGGHRVRVAGPIAFGQMVDEIERKCGEKLRSTPGKYMASVYQTAALWYARRYHCDRFYPYMDRAVRDGLKPEHVENYRKNYVSYCPARDRASSGRE